MNLLPADLKALILIYSPYEQLRAYCSQNQCDAVVYIAHLAHRLGLPKNFISEIWNSPEHFYKLNHEDNYLRVLSYFKVVKGSERFLARFTCYNEAVDSFDFPLAQYFGGMVGYNYKDVVDNLYPNLPEIAQFIDFPDNRTVSPDWLRIKNGEPVNFSGLGIRPTLLLCLIYKKYNTFETLIKNHNVSDITVEEVYLTYYMIKGDLRTLKTDFPQIDQKIRIRMDDILKTVDSLNPDLSYQFIQYIVSLNPEDYLDRLKDLRFLTIYYLYHKDLLTKIPELKKSMTVLPIILYIYLKLGVPTDINNSIATLAGGFRDANLENINVALNYYASIGETETIEFIDKYLASPLSQLYPGIKR